MKLKQIRGEKMEEKREEKETDKDRTQQRKINIYR